MSKFGTVFAFDRFRFEANGRVCPSGHTVTYVPLTVAPTAVTFIATAVAFAGIPFTPATFNLTIPPAGTAPRATPVPLRVSIARTGVSGV